MTTAKTYVTFHLDLDASLDDLWVFLVYAIGADPDSLTKDRLRGLLVGVPELRTAILGHFLIKAYAAGIETANRTGQKIEDKPTALEAGYRANNVFHAIWTALDRNGITMLSHGDHAKGRRMVEETVARHEAIQKVEQEMAKAASKFFEAMTSTPESAEDD